MMIEVFLITQNLTESQVMLHGTLNTHTHTHTCTHVYAQAIFCVILNKHIHTISILFYFILEKSWA